VTKSTRRQAYFALTVATLAIALFFLLFPNYVIRPTRSQGPTELQAALFVLRFQHIAELLCAAFALASLVMYLRSKPPGSRIGAIAGAVVVFLCLALSRVNIYEVLFHPVGSPVFQSARDTRLDGDDYVLTVTQGRQARAYPIRTLAYHHIVNDQVGGVPIAVTY
jgi:hypothetical protein